MIKSFTITNHLGESLELILADPDSSGLAVLSVTGLGQVDADVNLTKLAGSDFSLANSANLTNRNVVFKLKYWGNDIEASRDIANKFFLVKKEIKVIVKTDHKELEFTGIVEKNEADIFSQKSGCTVSILCPDPFMYENNDTDVYFAAIEPMLEFPFPNEERCIEDDDGFEMFEVNKMNVVNQKSIYYTGEAETGITIITNAVNPVKGLTFYNLDTSEKIAINDDIVTEITGDGIKAGDKIVISTVKTKKYATLTRDGVVYNIINALSKNRSWFSLSRGDNIFTYSATEGQYEVNIIIKYRTTYEGI